MPTIGHGPLIALGILGAAAYLEAVLVLYLRRSERALLAAVQREKAENNQRTPLRGSHHRSPPAIAYGPNIASGHFPSHRNPRRHTRVSQVCHIQVSNPVDNGTCSKFEPVCDRSWAGYRDVSKSPNMAINNSTISTEISLTFTRSSFSGGPPLLRGPERPQGLPKEFDHASVQDSFDCRGDAVRECFDRTELR